VSQQRPEILESGQRLQSPADAVAEEYRFAVEARVGGAVVAEGQLVLAIQGRNAAAQE
jgi:hypothetical protein